MPPGPNPNSNTGWARIRCRRRSSKRRNTGAVHAAQQSLRGYTAYLLGVRAGAIRFLGPGQPDDFQDGQAFKNPDGDLRAQNVMDNLIYRHEIPVMLAVFINPGRTPEQPEPTLAGMG